MRTYRGLLLVAPVLLALACGVPAASEDGSAERDIPTALTPTAGQPKYGGLMTIAIAEGPKTMDPYFTSGVTMNHVGRPIFQTLLEVYQPTADTDTRTNNQVEPLLAERWEMPDDKTLIFHLRKAVKFHNGDEMDADDVVFSLEYARDPKNAFAARSQYRQVDQIEKMDPYTVRITLREVDAEILRRFTSGQYILSKEFFDKGGDPKQTAAGTGPFRQIKFDPSAESVSVKHDNYWGRGKPYLDGIRHLFGLERSGILAAFATRKLDFYNVTDKVQFDEFRRQAPDLKYWIFHTDYNYGWYPNVSRPPLNDIRVRRAMQLTIDRHTLNDAVAFGMGRISAPGDAGFLREFFPQGELFKTPGWRQPKEPDIAEAKRLMREAGYASGFKVKGVYISTYTTVPQIAELMASQLKSALNIDIELVGLETPLWSDAVDRRGDFDLAMGNTRIVSDPDTNLTNYWYSRGSFNKAGINYPRLDELILRQKTIVDPVERRKVWADIAREIQDQVLYLSGLDGAYFGIVQPWVNNMYPNYAAQPWLRKPAEVWFDVDRMPQDRVKAPR